MGGVQPPPCSSPTNATIRTFDHCTSFAIPADKLLVINEGYYLPWSWLVMENEPSWMEVMITSIMENQNHWITWVCLFMMDHQWLVNRKVLIRSPSRRRPCGIHGFSCFCLFMHLCHAISPYIPRFARFCACHNLPRWQVPKKPSRFLCVSQLCVVIRRFTHMCHVFAHMREHACIQPCTYV